MLLSRRRARVVESGGLENRYARKGIEGSNPSASAKNIYWCGVEKTSKAARSSWVQIPLSPP